MLDKSKVINKPEEYTEVTENLEDNLPYVPIGRMDGRKLTVCCGRGNFTVNEFFVKTIPSGR